MNLSHLAIGAQEKNILYIIGLSIDRDWSLMLHGLFKQNKTGAVTVQNIKIQAD